VTNPERALRRQTLGTWLLKVTLILALAALSGQGTAASTKTESVKVEVRATRCFANPPGVSFHFVHSFVAIPFRFSGLKDQAESSLFHHAHKLRVALIALLKLQYTPENLYSTCRKVCASDKSDDFLFSIPRG
jgi:hypothetical protein